jgi:hypothetical protein
VPTGFFCMYVHQLRPSKHVRLLRCCASCSSVSNSCCFYRCVSLCTPVEAYHPRGCSESCELNCSSAECLVWVAHSRAQGIPLYHKAAQAATAARQPAASGSCCCRQSWQRQHQPRERHNST